MPNIREQLVAEFYEAANVTQTPETHFALIREEAREVREAAQALLKEIADLEYVIAGAVVQGAITPDTEDEELSLVLLKMLEIAEMVHPALRLEVFKRVHESNMSKLVDGKPLRDPETGKVLKGPNYKAPDLSDLV